MLREFKSSTGKVVHADYKAKVAMKTGMVVVMDDATKEAKFVSAGTAAELYFVDKERVATGINTSRADMSDYDANFTELAIGEFPKLKKYVAGEVIGSDAVGTTAPTAGKVVMAGTDGNLIDATSLIASPYLYVKDVVDNGHTLMQIKVLEVAIKNV